VATSKAIANDSTKRIEQRLDLIIALLLRLIPDSAVAQWESGRVRSEIVGLMLDLDLDLDTVSKTTGLTYGTVANTKSRRKKGKST